MDEQFVKELIEDLDHVSQMLDHARQLFDRCVGKLRSQVSGGAAPSSDSKFATQTNATSVNIRAEIEKQRQVIMAQVEQVRAQAMKAAQAAQTPVPSANPMPGLGLGNLPMGGAGMPPAMLEELRQRLAEAGKAGKADTEAVVVPDKEKKA